MKLGAIDEAVKLGTDLLAMNHNKAGDLSKIFAGVIGLDLKQEPDPRLSKLALRAARRANELSKGRNFMVLDLLAVALYRTGDIAGAVATGEKAIEVYESTVSAKDKALSRSKSLLKGLEADLETFLKAAAAKGIEIDKL